MHALERVWIIPERLYLFIHAGQVCGGERDEEEGKKEGI